jgi:hypothetical protein
MGCDGPPPRRQDDIMLRIIIVAAMLVAFVAPASPASDPSDAALKELRRTFTVHGKPVPPEVFGDFGDADMADSGPIRVTIDLLAAIDSNLYYGDIAVAPNGWTSQKKLVQSGAATATEETGYKFEGVTRNGLLVVMASFSGGGSGAFITLHILDAVAAHGFDSDGKRTDRLNLTILRSIPLGDRWAGSIAIANDTIAVISVPHDPPSSPRQHGTELFQAMRP